MNNKTKENKVKKQNIIQINVAANSGLQEMVDKILKNPDNYQPENCPFNFKSKSGIYSQACLIGLQWMIDHPKQAPSNGEINLFAQAVGQQLFPLLDARLATLNETIIANYLNTRSTNLYAKLLAAGFANQFGAHPTNISMTKLLSGVNKNIDMLIDFEKKQILGGKPILDKKEKKDKKED